MERYGDVMTEFKSCESENYSHSRTFGKKGNSKMCKDDISKPLFCSVNDCVTDEVIMEVRPDIPKKCVEFDCNNQSAENGYRSHAENFLSAIKSKAEEVINDCILPWEKSSNFSQNKKGTAQKLTTHDTFVNGSKILKSSVAEGEPNSKNSKFSDISQNISSNNIVIDNEADRSLSSIEILGPLTSTPVVKKRNFVNHIYNVEAKFDENIVIKSEKLDSDHEETGLPYHSENFNKESPSCKNSVESNPNVDWNMPELIPTICLDNDDSAPETEDKNCKVIDVADSPEMPTLIPFEAEESFQIKVECLDNEEKDGSKDTDSHDSAAGIRQPQIVLQRISVDRCDVPCPDSGRSSIGEQLNLLETKKMSIEGPEIEEIEGVRFFQFRSKQEMDEFNRMPEAAEIDLDMIVPTKTTDITQIKGWRNKYFAPETQFQSFTNCKGIKTDDSSNFILTLNKQNKEGKVFELNEEQKHSNEFGIHRSENDMKVTEVKLNEDNVEATPVLLKDETSDRKCSPDKSDEKSSVEKNDEKCSPEKNDEKCSPEKKDEKCSPEKKDEKYSPEKKDEKYSPEKKDEKYSPEKNPMSAFVSAELDSYLLNSSTLNVTLLQKVNPNIIPIPPDAPILSLGKLRKTDRVIQPKKSHVFKDKEDNLNSSDCVITLDDSPAPIITIGSSDEDSADDDIPVAKLSGIKKIRSTDVKPVPNKCAKKKKIGDVEACRVSPRVVLRLKKENTGSSEGYKVSNISLKKENTGSSEGYKVSNISCKKSKIEQPRTSSSSSSSSDSEEEMPESFKMSYDGSLPVIKKTLFLKDDEPHLLEEFLNNLNMYGTRKDVAMLVQSNQSYFDKGPALSAHRTCKAIAALVSNELFAKLKFKQKVKKKVKSWEKYLPKKLSKVQKLTMSKLKSKLKSSEVVDNTLPPERGKRSIRLPARYLDSAVLAAGSEWVSPVLVPAESVTKKSRKLSSETVEKKSIPENTKDSVSCTEKSTSEEEESSSDETDDTSDDLSDDTIEHIKEECSKKFQQKSEYSEVLNMKNHSLNKTKANIESLPNTDDDQNLLSDAVNPFPVCSCLPCSRTVVYQKSKKDFVCSCKIIKDKNKTITLDESSKQNNTDTFTNNSLQSVSELTDSKISVREEMSRLKPVSSSEETSICSDTPGCISMPSVKKSDDVLLSNILSSSVTVQSKPYEPVSQNASVSKSPIYLTNLGLRNSLGSIKQPFSVAQNDSMASLSTPNSVTCANNNMQSYPVQKVFNPLEDNSSGALVSVPVSNMSDKFIFLVPVKATTNVSKTGQGSHVPLLPKIKTPDTFEKPLVSSTINPKGKLPILIRKVTSDKVPNTSVIEPGSGLNFLNCNTVNSEKLPFVPSLSHPSTPKNTPSTSPLTFKLPKTVENTESNFLVQNGSPKLQSSFSAVLNNTVTTDKTPQILNSCNTSVTLSSSVQQVNPQGLQVRAYKVGDKFFIYPSVMPAKELRPKSSPLNNSTILATSAANQRTLQSISPQVLPFSNINKENLKCQYQILQNGLTKQYIIGNHDSNESCLSSSSDPLKDVQTDPSMLKAGSAESLPNCTSAATDCHNYYKTQKSNKRKPSPCNDVKENLDMDIDIETVDDNFDGLSELRKTSEIFSESDISDNECESMYSSNSDPFAINSQVKSLRERKRRLQIRYAFEKLKSSSKSFKNANTCMEILAVACLVIKRATKQEKKLMCIKKWEQLRNAKLLKKLKQTINGIEEQNVRKVTKLQCIKFMAHDWLLRRRKRKSPLPSTKKKLKRFKLSKLRKEAGKSSAVSSATEIDLEANLKKSVADVSADAQEKSACSVQKELQNSNTDDKTSDLEANVKKSVADVSAVAEEKSTYSVQKELQSSNADDKTSEPESGYKRMLRSSHRIKDDDSSDVQVIDSSSKQPCESVLNNKLILAAKKRKREETELAVKNKNESKDGAEPELQSHKSLSKTTATNSSVSSDDEPLVIDLSDNDDDGDNDKTKKQLSEKPLNIAEKETMSIESKMSEQSSQKDKVQKRQYPGVIPLYHQMPLNDDVHSLVAARHHTLLPQLPANDSSPQKVSNTVQSSCRQTLNSDISRVIHNPTNPKYDEHMRVEGECVNTKNAKQSLSPLKSNNSHITSQKHDAEVPLAKVDLLSKAAETARKVFGPCSVQRVHLKNGKTVYAYAPHEVPKLTSDKNSTVSSSHTMPIGLSHSGNNVRNLDDVFHAIDSISKGVSCAQNSSVLSVPEEIILDDSDDEVQEIRDASCRTLNVHNSAVESSEHKDTNIELREHPKISNYNMNL